MARKIIVTHDGKFHADDVFAVAALLLVEKDAQVIRTRDARAILHGDSVVDVGGVYDEQRNRFDHHQVNGAGKREHGLPAAQGTAPASALHAGGQAGIPYAAFGLVWKKFGEKLCGSASVARRVEETLVIPIDANDNGIDLSVQEFAHGSPYEVSDAIRSFNPTWQEKESFLNTHFTEAVAFAKRIIEREMKRAEAADISHKEVEAAYREASDKRLIVLNEDYSWKDVLALFPEPLYVVHPVRSKESSIPADSPKATRTSNGVHPQNGTWRLYAVRDNPHLFANRKDLPPAWAGLRDAELAKVTGIPDAIFAHRNRFMAVAQTREGAIALAKLALG